MRATSRPQHGDPEHDEHRRAGRLNGEYERDEAGQAAYLRELLDIFDSEGVDSAFVHLFALDSLPHRPDGDPRDDLDLASLGIVKVLEDRNGDTYPDMPWEPKIAFTGLAEYHRGDPRQPSAQAALTGPGSPPMRA